MTDFIHSHGWWATTWGQLVGGLIGITVGSLLLIALTWPRR